MGRSPSSPAGRRWKRSSVRALTESSFVTFVAVLSSVCFSERYFVRPDGSDANDGLSGLPGRAWRSIDRGQPTVLAEDTDPGQSTVRVAKASQFPRSGRVRIGKSVVSYISRTNDVLEGCEGVPRAREGTLVESLDLKPAGPGDTVIVLPGVYFCHFTSERQRREARGAVMFFRGGKSSAPLRVIAKGRAIIDGRDIGLTLLVQSRYLSIEGLEIRRGGIALFMADGSRVRNCRVYEGNRGITCAYSKDVQTERNTIYDLKGA